MIRFARASILILSGHAMCFAAWTSVDTSWGAERDEELVSRIHAEGVAAWREHEKAWTVDATIECLYEEHINDTGDDGKPKSLVDTRIIAIHLPTIPNRYISQWRWKSDDSVDHVRRTLGNERYSCEIHQENGGSFALTNARRQTDVETRPINSEASSFRWYTHAGAYIWFNVPITEALSNSEFSLAVAKHIPLGLVRIEFTYSGLTINGRVAGSRYWVEVDPRNKWLARRSGVELPSRGASFETEISYWDGADFKGLPRQFKRLRQVTSATESGRDELVITFEKPGPCKSKTSEFFLPHYGISESAIGEYVPASGYRVWLFVVAIVGAFGAGLAFWYANRTRGSRPSGA